MCQFVFSLLGMRCDKWIQWKIHVDCSWETTWCILHQGRSNACNMPPWIPTLQQVDLYHAVRRHEVEIGQVWTAQSWSKELILGYFLIFFGCFLLFPGCFWICLPFRMVQPPCLLHERPGEDARLPQLVPGAQKLPTSLGLPVLSGRCAMASEFLGLKLLFFYESQPAG